MPRDDNSAPLRQRKRRAQERCITDLQTALQQAQEELAEGKRVLKTVPRRIHKLKADRDDARRHWRRCEDGWNRVILQAEGFQRDYLSAIERGKQAWESGATAHGEWQQWLDGCIEAEDRASAQRARAETAEWRLRWHHASHPTPKRPPRPALSGVTSDPDLCPWCIQADYEAQEEGDE